MESATRSDDDASDKAASPLRRLRKRLLGATALYIVLLVLSWTLTCLMMFRPVMKPSYEKAATGAYAYTDEDARAMGRWLRATKIMNTIATVMALPVFMVLLDCATAKYIGPEGEDSGLSKAQLLVFADRGWVNVPQRWRRFSREGGRLGSRLLFLSPLLMLIALAQPPIQSALVRYEPFSIATCTDVPAESYRLRNTSVPHGCPYNELYWAGRSSARRRWFEAEPGWLALFPRGLVVPRVMRKLYDVDRKDIQSYLWPEEGPGEGTLPLDFSSIDDNSFSWFGYREAPKFYAAALPRGSTTGVLRYHALRQHTAVRCQAISTRDFPSTCPGDSPFTTSLSGTNMYIKICVPGVSDRSPWTLSRSRQDLVEDLWIDSYYGEMEDIPQARKNFTVRCTSNATRGYFELGSKHNGNMPGPLLETWPTRETLLADFNDLAVSPPDSRGEENAQVSSESTPTVGRDYSALTRQTNSTLQDLGALESDYLPTPGPLMTSALALFGDTSFFATLRNATQLGNSTAADEALQRICHGGAAIDMPFARMSSYYGLNYHCREVVSGASVFPTETTLLRLANDYVEWVGRASALNVTTFFAGEVLLTSASMLPYQSTAYASGIYSSEGFDILRPKRSMAAVIVVSALVLVQVIGVVGLLVYTVVRPREAMSTPIPMDERVVYKASREGSELGGSAGQEGMSTRTAGVVG